jgi:hypothetical protein
MTRSPLFYPMNRGMDADAGGAADLQTDVMRFMAILSLCLVAIFALVQSLPLAPPAVVTEPPVAVVPEPTPPAKIPAPREKRVEVSAAPIEKTTPATQREPELSSPEPVVAQTPQPVPTTVLPTAEIESAVPLPDAPPVEPAQPVTATEEEGFSLRFEHDRALTALVGREQVALYAMARDKTLRMHTKFGQIRFEPAGTPSRFHEMEVSTVPRRVVDALRRTGSMPPAAVKWGVTLPTGMTRRLDQILAEHSGGRLVIRNNGELELER